MRPHSAAAAGHAGSPLFSLLFGLHAAATPDPSLVHVALRVLGGDPREAWMGPPPVRSEFAGDVGILATREHVLVHASRAVAAGTHISDVTTSLYRDLLARTHGFPHLVRIWNFVPGINRGEADAETYVQFNRGRAVAFDAAGIAVARFPAATAVGGPAGTPLTVLVLASRTAPVPVENPRQTSAYHYPRQYGPRPPAFARAMLLPEAGRATLFISGIASIVGHESRHKGIRPQLLETLANLDELVARAASLVPAARRADGGRWRVYLRDPADLAVAQELLAPRLGGRDAVLFLQADICRRELLVEIEGVCGFAADAG